jgi:hypothetical protein
MAELDLILLLVKWDTEYNGSKWFIIRKGYEFGPLGIADVAAWLDQGRLVPEDHLRLDKHRSLLSVSKFQATVTARQRADAASNADYYIFREGQEPTGPLSQRKIAELASHQQIEADDRLLRDDWSETVPAWRITQLAPLFFTLLRDNSNGRLLTADLNGAGGLDTLFADADGDGRIDTVFTDITGNGEFDTVLADLNGNGLADTFAMDTNGDGLADIFGADLSGNGMIDAVAVDVDGDGLSDVTVFDTDGDGIAEIDAGGGFDIGSLLDF